MDSPSSSRSSFGSMPSTRLGIDVRVPIWDAMIWSIDVPTRISLGFRLTGAPDSTFMRPRCGLLDAAALWLKSPCTKTMSSR